MSKKTFFNLMVAVRDITVYIALFWSLFLLAVTQVRA